MSRSIGNHSGFTFVMSGLFMIFISTSCNLYKDVEVTQVQEVRVAEATEEGFIAEVYLELENPNWYNVVLKKSEVDVFLEGNKIGELEMNDKIVIPKKTTSTQVLRMEADYEKMQGILTNMLVLLFKKEYVLEGNGFVKGRALFVSKKVKVNISETITREQLGF